MTSRQLARLLRQCLEEGSTVEVDGLGLFRHTRSGEFQFESRLRPRIFLAYVQEDLRHVQRLYRALARAGYDPWLDKRKLLPGQNWPRSIERAIGVSDFFIACFSPRSVSKRGAFQSELRYALDCAAKLPLDQVYFIPVRIEECDVPDRVTREIQYVDLFPDWEKGFQRVVSSIERQRSVADRRRLALAGQGRRAGSTATKGCPEADSDSD